MNHNSKDISQKITFKEFTSEDDMIQAYGLVSQMYEKMSKEEYKKNIREMIAANNFKMLAVFVDDKMVAVCGYWILLMLYCGKYIQISNLVVDKDFRGLGIGKKILEYFKNKGKELGCDKLVLDSYTENKKSHSLYFRENFYVRGLHFMQDL